MKQSALKFIPIILALLVLGTATGWAQTRVATVDLRKLFEKYYKTELAQKALKEKGNELAAESNSMREEAKKISEEYRKLLSESNDQALSPDIRTSRKDDAEEKLRELKKTEENIVAFERDARVRLEEQNRRMRGNIIEEIRAVVNAKAKSGGYSMVIDITADSVNATPVVLYNNGDNDLTDAVLAQMNAAAPIDLKAK